MFYISFIPIHPLTTPILPYTLQSIPIYQSTEFSPPLPLTFPLIVVFREHVSSSGRISRDRLRRDGRAGP